MAADQTAKDATPTAQALRPSGYIVFPLTTQARFFRDSKPASQTPPTMVSCNMAGNEFESIQIGVHAATGELTNIRLRLESDLESIIYRRMEPDFDLKWPNRFTHHEPMPPESLLLQSDTIEKIARGESANFWLTFHAGPKTTPGLHAGRIRIQPEGDSETVIELQVQVRPFILHRPRISYGLYHCHYGYPDFAMQPEQLEKVFQGMADHGETACAFYWGEDFSVIPPKSSLTKVMMPLAEKVGLIHPDIPCLVLSNNLQEITEEERRNALAWLAEKQASRGWPELVSYGWDEPAYPKAGLREKYAPFRTDPLRVGTALNSVGAYAYGDVHDIWILHDNEGTPEILAEAERTGSRLWTYSYRIWRQGYSPLRQRYYAGFYTWAKQFEGNMIWAYFDNRIHGHVWWPNPESGPMPVVAWEGRREGIDDYRYLQMLEDCIAANPGDTAAVEAKAWLNALRVQMLRIDPLEIDLDHPISVAEYDGIREQAASFILQLGPPEERPARVPAKVPHVKDEAGPYREMTIDQCIAALASPELEARRGAAAALAERGPAAAPALGALAELLQDGDARVPALRALEAMGPRAIAAVPEITRLLAHEDAFIRVCATVALTGIAQLLIDPDEEAPPAPVEPATARARRAVIAPLKAAFLDPFPAAAQAAGQALARLGDDAKLALPEALAVLNRPGWRDRYAALILIQKIGPEHGAVAIPAVAALYARAGGHEVTAVRTLALFGPAAARAIPIIEEQAANPRNIYHEFALSALVQIRGDAGDIERLAEVLELKQERRQDQKLQVIRELAELGARARPCIDRVRALQATGYFDEHQEALDQFFEAVTGNQDDSK